MTTFGRTCSVRAYDLATERYWWEMELTSTFYYNYSTLWQDPPTIWADSTFPYLWDDVYAYNSYWSQTVRFADGWGDLWVFYIIGYVMTATKHVWIQEDAWGNCTVYGSG